MGKIPHTRFPFYPPEKFVKSRVFSLNHAPFRRCPSRRAHKISSFGDNKKRQVESFAHKKTTPFGAVGVAKDRSLGFARDDREPGTTEVMVQQRTLGSRRHGRAKKSSRSLHGFKDCRDRSGIGLSNPVLHSQDRHAGHGPDPVLKDGIVGTCGICNGGRHP